MKKLLLLAIFVVMTSVASAQFSGFFKPIPKDVFGKVETIDRDATVDASTFWTFRPIFQVSAMQIMLEKPARVMALNSLGTGLSYAHFIEQNGEPYMNFSANLMVLFGTEIADVSPLQLSLAGSVTLWQHLSFGAGYSLYHSRAFILTGVVVNFN